MLLRLIERWRSEAERGGRPIARVVVAYEAGRDGFWLARWLMTRGIEVHVIHSASVAVSRERKRAKTDRLDAAMLMRVLLGWLRGERGHCSMVAIPSVAEEDARRPSRERETLVGERARISNWIKGALSRRREKGLTRAGNARVRRGLIQLAWRFLLFQKQSALTQWYRVRTSGANAARRKSMIVALARKLLIALWRLVTTGEVPQGVVLRPAV